MVYRFTYKFTKKSVRCNGGTSTGATMDFGIGQVSRQRYLSCCVKDRAIFSYAVSLLRIRKKEPRSFKKIILALEFERVWFVNQNITHDTYETSFLATYPQYPQIFRLIHMIKSTNFTNCDRCFFFKDLYRSLKCLYPPQGDPSSPYGWRKVKK